MDLCRSIYAPNDQPERLEYRTTWQDVPYCLEASLMPFEDKRAAIGITGLISGDQVRTLGISVFVFVVIAI